MLKKVMIGFMLVFVLWLGQVYARDIKLSWEHPDTTGTIGYNVYRCELEQNSKTGQCGDWVLLNDEPIPLGTLTYEDVDLPRNQLIYQVRAVGQHGESEPSNAALFYILEIPVSPTNMRIE